VENLIFEVTTRGLHLYHHINNNKTTVGRALDNDIILSDPTVAPYHLEIFRDSEGLLRLQNLAEVNPATINQRNIDPFEPSILPMSITLGNVKARLLRRDYPMPATRPLIATSRTGRLLYHRWTALLLVLVSLVAGGLEFYLGSYHNFKMAALLQHLLKDTVLTIGIATFVLTILGKILTNRWDVLQVLGSVCLLSLLYTLTGSLADGLTYLFSSSLPETIASTVWYLVILPAAIALYLTHISHIERRRSLLVGYLLSSPILLVSILQNQQLRNMFDEFDNTPGYENSLSALNWHLADTIEIKRFIAEARDLEAGKISN